jgi:hypothetical protein
VTLHLKSTKHLFARFNNTVVTEYSTVQAKERRVKNGSSEPAVQKEAIRKGYKPCLSPRHKSNDAVAKKGI